MAMSSLLSVGAFLAVVLGVSADELHGAPAQRAAPQASLRGAGAVKNATASGARGAHRQTSSFGSSPCKCGDGCSDRHCGAVNDVFQMIRFNRDGQDCKTSGGCQGGALLHMIGSPVDVEGMLGEDGRIDWLNDISFGGDYPVINDCMYKNDDHPGSCSAAALLRSDLLPIVFNYPYSVANMHPIGLLFDPWLLKDDSYGIKAMFVLDGDTVEHPWWNGDHAQCRVQDGWGWPTDFDAASGVFDTADVQTAMVSQCYFSLEGDSNWAGFWGNFIDARKAAQRYIRDARAPAIPDDGSFLEPEIDMVISDPAAWDSMYRNALQAVVVQTNYCSEQLGSKDVVAERCTEQDEDSLIVSAKLGACRVASQIKHDTGRDLPVIEASLLTNSMYNEAAWESFRSDDDYIANPEDYMQYFDCCWLLNEDSLTDDLLAVNWYEGQCCWEQDGEFWKNCDYCTSCSPQ